MPGESLRFGTDGVRGVAFSQLTEEFVGRLGFAAAQVLGAQRFVVGADTRESSPRLTAALTQGLRAAGAEVIDLSVVATPVVSFACGLWNCSGAMVSASHNPWTDNGVKLFATGGTKLSDQTEQAIAEQIAVGIAIGTESASAIGIATGNAPTAVVPEAKPEANTAGSSEVMRLYESSLAAGIGGRSLEGLRLVVDTANGATASYAAEVLSNLGAEVEALFDAPDGRNINEDCGSSHPQATQAEVIRSSADLGLCFDGDGDRLIAVDSAGHLINGDRLLVLFARDLAAAGELAQRTLVTTVMSNLGLREALETADIAIEETAVGDRYVLNAIDAGGFDLGGEQSGHIIFRRLAATGDGLRSGVQLADLLLRSRKSNPNQSSAELAANAMTQYPQVLKGVLVSENPENPENRAQEILAGLPPALERQINELATAARPHTRVLVRPSGTEPLVRVMVEAASSDYADQLCDQIVALVRTELHL